mgnify:CR=1 FL=1
MPSWPWVVKGSSATSVMTPSAGWARFTAAIVRGTSPASSQAAAASSDLAESGTTGNRAIAGRPSSTSGLPWPWGEEILARCFVVSACQVQPSPRALGIDEKDAQVQVLSAPGARRVKVRVGKRARSIRRSKCARRSGTTPI